VSRTLTALPFDATGLKSTGEAFPVTENVAANDTPLGILTPTSGFVLSITLLRGSAAE
jgi:hypothetical protein